MLDELIECSVRTPNLNTNARGRAEGERRSEKRTISRPPRRVMRFTQGLMKRPPDTCKLLLGAGSCKHQAYNLEKIQIHNRKILGLASDMSFTFDCKERLGETEARSLGIDMSVPLQERIDQLCELVYAGGGAKPSKKKMLSALVLGASEDAAALTVLLAAYDRACVRDALVGGADGDVVRFPKRRPGPRSRQRSGAARSR